MKRKLVLLIIVISIIITNASFVKAPQTPSAIVVIPEQTTITATTTTTSATTTTTTIPKVEEYPIARKVWDIMKSYGWNDIICAGIMGNMMRECGGDTLKLRWNAVNRSGNHYGLCQWSKRYYSEIWGGSIEEQMEYLKNSLDLGMFNKCKTPSEAAFIFSKYYERPA